MSEMNNIEIIQNKLDALVEKIIQKENSDENFRITYAQILEKINTKMDVFSSDENLEKLGLLSLEIRKLITDRQDVVDSKFSAIKGEFDNLNEILSGFLKTPELLAAYEKIQDQMNAFEEGQEKQKELFNSIINNINLNETNDTIRMNFAIVKEQNSIINETVNKQINSINALNEFSQEANKKSLEDLNTIIFTLKEFEESLNDDVAEIKDFVTEKVDTIISKIHETDSYIDVLNNNLTTLVQVVGNLFDDEDFVELKSDVGDILAKTAFLSETLKTLATKDEFLENTTKNKEEIKQYNKELLTELEQKIIQKLDFSDLQDVKEYTEKMFFQGTEVLKEEIWSIKDTISEVKENALSKECFSQKIVEIKDELRETLTEDIIDTISTESVAAANQTEQLTEEVKKVSESLDNIKSDIPEKISKELDNIKKDIPEKISNTIEDLRQDLSDIILNEQNEQINTALSNLQNKFVTQLVQIAENISLDEVVNEINENIFNVSDEIKEKISSDISDIRAEMQNLKNVSSTTEDNIIKMLEDLNSAVQSDINKDLKALLSGFKLLTSGLKEEKDYVYTLPDIEADLSKIRVDLSNLQKAVNNSEEENSQSVSEITTKIAGVKDAIEKLEKNPINTEIAEVKSLFDTLNEDISSISKRTNKLILASDEVNKTLRFNIENFSKLISSFEKQSMEFYNSAFVNNLDIKIDNITQIVSALIQSNKIINEAFVYLAEWIDSASDSFDELKADMTKVKKSILKEEDDSIQKLEEKITDFGSKIDAQNSKIESINKKLDSIIETQNETKELKSLVEYVASQVSVTNEKIVENDKLAQRITNIEKQLKKIEKNIAIITEYIDEDEENDFDMDEE